MLELPPVVCYICSVPSSPFAQVCAGLCLLGFSFHAFHRRAAERSGARQQYRAGRRAGGGAVATSQLADVHGSGGDAAAVLQALQQDSEAAAAGGELVTNGGTAAQLAAADTRAFASAHARSNRESAAEVLAHCERNFGLEWVRRWGAAAQQVCTATRALAGGGAGGDAALAAGGDLGASAITCRSINDTHMPAASAPHVLCDAVNLRLDPSKLVGA